MKFKISESNVLNISLVGASGQAPRDATIM